MSILPPDLESLVFSYIINPNILKEIHKIIVNFKLTIKTLNINSKCEYCNIMDTTVNFNLHDGYGDASACESCYNDFEIKHSFYDLSHL